MKTMLKKYTNNNIERYNSYRSSGPAGIDTKKSRAFNEDLPFKLLWNMPGTVLSCVVLIIIYRTIERCHQHLCPNLTIQKYYTTKRKR